MGWMNSPRKRPRLAGPFPCFSGSGFFVNNFPEIIGMRAADIVEFIGLCIVAVTVDGAEYVGLPTSGSRDIVAGVKVVELDPELESPRT